jgi:putative NADPH-quinone reductase
MAVHINIYYGGRGIIEDPTLYVLKKIESVFEDIRVSYTRYNLYDMKNSITTLPQTLKDADGIILACSVEWMGIGGYMQQFLDACWFYGDKTKISSLYMTPVVISTTYGEKDAMLTLKNAWELLGGLLSSGICAYVEDTLDFERNSDYNSYIDKKAENIYRTISQKVKPLPSSSLAIKNNLIKSSMELTPQESEQLSKYVSDDIYVKQQKEDIEQLASFFKEKLSEQGTNIELEFVKPLTTIFTPQESFEACYSILIQDKNKYLYIKVENDELYCKYEKHDDVDVLAKTTHAVLDDITHGRITFQKAFMTGVLTAKGNFKTLRMLDQLFPFS